MSTRTPAAPKLDNWGQPGNLTPDQQETLTNFRAQVKESDLDIVKFKIESYENVSLRKTEDRYDYYAKLTPDQCAECSVDALCKFYPHGQVGYDVFNRPILFEHSCSRWTCNSSNDNYGEVDSLSLVVNGNKFE